MVKTPTTRDINIQRGQVTSPIYRAPMKITGYPCIKCDKYHLRPSKKFIAHYQINSRNYGFAPLEEKLTR